MSLEERYRIISEHLFGVPMTDAEKKQIESEIAGIKRKLGPSMAYVTGSGSGRLVERKPKI